MLTIRNAQMEVLSAQQRQKFVDAMCEFLRLQFKQELQGISQTSLQAKVSAALNSASRYGLRSHRDCCRYLNLAVTYGWEFEQLPENAWMREYLTDPNAGNPSQRLQRLISQCIYKMEVEENNRQMREAFGTVENLDADEEEQYDELEEDELLIANDWDKPNDLGQTP